MEALMFKMRAVLRPMYLAVVALLVLAVVVATTPARPVAIKATPTASTGSWTVYHGNNAHTGFDPTQPKVASASAGWATGALDDQIYAEPLIYNGIVYAATLNNTVYALNQSDGTQVWATHIRSPETGGWLCGGFTQGIVGTPVIDAAGGRIYVVTLEPGTPDDTYRLEGLNLLTGASEFSRVIMTRPATGFDWTIQQQRGALGLANGYVYVPFGGRNGDCGTYHGWIFAVPIAGGTIPYYVTPGFGAGFWGAGGVVVDATGNVFEASGNGSAGGCAANGDGTAMFENDAVARFSPTLAHLDAFYPQDWAANWCNNDEDLGSATPVLLNSNLMFEAGKWGMGFLLDPNHLGGMDGQLFPTPKGVPYVEAPVCFGNTHDATFGSFAYAAPFVYLECNGHGLVGLSVDTVTPSFSICNATCAAPDIHMGGTMTFGPPIVAGGAVWAIDINGSGLYAYDSATGVQIFHSAAFGVNHFVTPAEAGGQVFVPAGDQIMSFNMTFACTGTPTSTTYFNWFDKASPGMLNDNIHIVNPGASTSSGCVTVNGHPGVSWTAAAGQETYATLPAGTIGGPVTVTVNTGPAVRASQRVQYYQSFNEVWAESAAQALTTGYFNWFDKASPGMFNDNIHLLNPGATSATVSVSLPGAATQMATVAAGAESYVTFPAGTIGGPVTVSSTQPVLASQRVQYNQSFNEVWAESSAQAVTSGYFNWFDKATPGMFNDNIHLLNPGVSSATVTVSLPGAASQMATVAAGAEAYVTFPAGKIGGPVTLSSTQPVLASQRVQFNQSFNEVWAEGPGQAVTLGYFNWFDRASPGMFNDNIHLLNPGGTSATVTVSLPGAPTQMVTVGPGAEAYVTFPAGKIGGPVTVSSTQPVLASQRVQYYSSFNEIWAG